MWIGGVRVIVLDNENRMLMVKQHHEEKGIIDVAADLTDCSFVCDSGRSEQRQGA